MNSFEMAALKAADEMRQNIDGHPRAAELTEDQKVMMVAAAAQLAAFTAGARLAEAIGIGYRAAHGNLV